MSDLWLAAARWLLHVAVGGGLLLLLTWLVSIRVRQPARRQRLAECGVAAALVLAGLCLAPAWLVIPLPVRPPDPVPPEARAEVPGPEEEPDPAVAHPGGEEFLAMVPPAEAPAEEPPRPAP